MLLRSQGTDAGNEGSLQNETGDSGVAKVDWVTVQRQASNATVLRSQLVAANSSEGEHIAALLVRALSQQAASHSRAHLLLPGSCQALKEIVTIRSGLELSSA